MIALLAQNDAWEQKDLTNQVITVPTASSDVYLLNLSNCVITATHPLSALRTRNLTNCKIILGPVVGSVHVEEAVDCVFLLASRQVRIHDTYRSEFSVCVRSGPIIEDCADLTFSRYRLTYPGLAEQLQANDLDLGSEEWKDVKDFKWLRAQQSPNWKLDLEERAECTVDSFEILSTSEQEKTE